MKTKKAYRHGELLLMPSKEEFDASKAKEVKNYIASHSETGHHHVVMGMSFVWERQSKETLLKVEKETNLKHEKHIDRHEDHVIPAGVYVIRRKKEYDPVEKIIREVRD